MHNRLCLIFAGIGLLLCIGCNSDTPPTEGPAPSGRAPDVTAEAKTQQPPPAPKTKAEQLAVAAMEQVGQTTKYDPAYVKLAYPGGDVPIERGVCTDVIVRALRKLDVDMQVLIHEDMKASFKSYPDLWGLSRPDPNIDHRRVPNIAAFLRRKGKTVPVTSNARDYLPGDIVVWKLPGGRQHTGIVSNARARGTDRCKIVHNIGAGTQLEDVLFAFEITDHFRYF